MPHSYRGKCNDFLDKYGKQIVEFFISTAAPHSICALLHVCLLEEAPRVGEGSALSWVDDAAAAAAAAAAASSMG